ncbi:bifunctional riboflavin kinase/FAD synthetase [Capilliphycus salinus ALCB114379]|uniref:bifunctional riboflavin kinase/FAD synthetase n=1 Tax=Capilliphycus salinus TaxID=2768948 RepID=UPI0039A67C38
MWITSSLDTVLTPTAVALGNFDGIHRGHRQVIQPIFKSFDPSRSAFVTPQQPEILLTQGDSSLPSPSLTQNYPSGFSLTPEDKTNHSDGGETPQLYATVVTFHPHPQELFTGQSKKLLTPIDEKIECLKAMGVEQVVLLAFDRQLASLSPREFVEEILLKHLQATQISIGFDFRFGKGRTGTATDLKAIASSQGVEVTIVERYPCEQGERISSSMIRQALESGNLERAHHLLGRNYTLVGQVVQGQQLGRTLGFPTANLQLPPEKFLPRYGVYAVEVDRRGEPSNLQAYPAVMNIGCRPTVAGQQPTVEVYLLGWSGDLYGQTLTVCLKEFLRPEQKFASLDELKAQIQADCLRAEKVLKNER